MTAAISHNPIAIANYFIEKSKRSLTLMQVIKLSYIAHGFKLGVFEKPLSKELAQAWKYGPVFHGIYNEFKWQPPGEIKKLGTGENEKDIPIKSNFSDNDKYVMDFVYDVYGGLSGWELSTLTHKQGTPWHECYYKGETPGKDFFGVPIPNKSIQQHYHTVVFPKLKHHSQG